MVIECPHCFTYVFPKPDGECPACQRNTRDLRDVDDDLVSVVIGEHSVLPDVCCVCGLTTRRVVKVTGTKPLDGFVPAGQTSARYVFMQAVLVYLFGAVGALVAHYINGSPSGWNCVRVPITQCDECAGSGPPQPLRVDHEHFAMRFAVRGEFARRFDELNTPPD